MKHQSQWTYYRQRHHLDHHPLPVQVTSITNYSDAVLDELFLELRYMEQDAC